jgi:hypothetical protein
MYVSSYIRMYVGTNVSTSHNKSHFTRVAVRFFFRRFGSIEPNQRIGSVRFGGSANHLRVRPISTAYVRSYTYVELGISEISALSVEFLRNEEHSLNQELPRCNEEFPAKLPVQPIQNNNRQHINTNFNFDMFDEINLLHNAQVRRPLEALDQQQLHVEEIMDAELALYKDEPTIFMFSTPGVYNDPLSWWQLNTRKYKLLSTLASRILCIPATSAPLERVFSVAGLTIAKDRARLASGAANDLIFLLEAIPAIEKYNISIGGGMV